MDLEGVYVDALATLENLIIQNNTSANREVESILKDR